MALGCAEDHSAAAVCVVNGNYIISLHPSQRTKARRLVPLCDALRARLLLHKQDSGPICGHADPRAALNRAVFGTEVSLKDNAFRHSYITFRVAQINNMGTVALEAGNSPDIIFARYREFSWS